MAAEKRKEQAYAEKKAAEKIQKATEQIEKDEAGRARAAESLVLKKGGLARLTDSNFALGIHGSHISMVAYRASDSGGPGAAGGPSDPLA